MHDEHWTFVDVQQVWTIIFNFLPLFLHANENITLLSEIAQRKGANTLVGISHVTEAHKEMFCSPKIMAIRCCSKYEKIFMQSMVAVFQKTGIEEASFDRVLSSMNDILKFEALMLLSVEEAHNIVGRLAACRLILMEPGKAGRLDLKLRLNVSQDDVMFALREDKK